MHIVPNWSDGRLIATDDGRSREFRRNHGIPSDAFVALYGGNIGVAAWIETIIEEFCYLKHISNLYLVIAGEGSNLVNCQVLANDIDNKRIVFHIPWL